ncbi:MAG TPA: MarR family transcriptional regulator [Anaerolineae bacterium]|nr:MarR family transcriptional regulator [Anaerolineae bacterium]
MKNQELNATATELRILMTILTKMARHDLQQHLDACGVDIGALPIGVMRLLHYQSLTIKDLSKHMALEPASLVPVIDDLERRNLVRRGTDPNDRRRTPLYLTEEGERLLMGIPALPIESPFVKAIEAMGEQKAQTLLALLRELANGMMQDKSTVSRISKAVRMQMAHQSFKPIERKWGMRKEHNPR